MLFSAMPFNHYDHPQKPIVMTELTDPWETESPIEEAPKAPPEFIRKIEAKIKQASEHLMPPVTGDVLRIAAPRRSETMPPEQLLLQDEIKIHGFAGLPLGESISRALALIWWVKGKSGS